MVSETATPKDSRDLSKSEVLFVEEGFSLTKVTHALESGWGQLGLVQLHLRKTNDTEDTLLVESYQEGFFVATWKTPGRIDDFLSAADGYFSEFEPTPDPEKTHHAILIPREGTSETVFEADYTRPLTLDDLKDATLPTGGDISKIGLLRLNDPMGDLIYETLGDLSGVIATSEENSIGGVRAAVSNFVNRTQPQIPTELVGKTLGFLPHVKPTTY